MGHLDDGVARHLGLALVEIDHHHRAALHGLVTRWRGVKDAQPAVTEANLTCGVDGAMVWATMGQGGQHALKRARQVGRTLLTQADIAEDSTHQGIVAGA